MWYSFGMNQQSYDLGLIQSRFSSVKSQYNLIDHNKFIDHVDEKFDLVMITERMEESLVLLADMLCVSLDTVAMVKAHNVRPKSQVKKLSQAIQDKLEQYLAPDRLLYKHFLRKFNTSNR